MDLATFNTLEPQYRLQLKDLVQAVSGPLTNGLCSFHKVSEMLLSVDGDIIQPESQVYHDIRKLIQDVNDQMEKSQQIASSRLQDVDRETERLTVDLLSFTNLKTQRESELKNMEKQLQTHEFSLQHYRQALETEKGYLKEAEEKRDEMMRRKQGGEVMTGVGGGLLVIPIFGWIIGGTLLGVGINEMNQASEAVTKAEDVVRNSESQVGLYLNKVSESQAAIHKTEGDIQKANENIQTSENQLQRVSQTRNSIAYVQEKIRCAVTQLDQLCAVSNVAELQTRYLIMVEPLMKVMEEMTTALGQISGGDLLHREGILYLMNNIKRNHEKHMARQIKCITVEDNYYYKFSLCQSCCSACKNKSLPIKIKD